MLCVQSFHINYACIQEYNNVIAPLLIYTQLENHICICVLHKFLGLIKYALLRIENMCIQIDKSMYTAGHTESSVHEILQRRNKCIQEINRCEHSLSIIQASIHTITTTIASISQHPTCTQSSLQHFNDTLKQVQQLHTAVNTSRIQYQSDLSDLNKQINKLEGPFYTRMQNVLYKQIKLKKEAYHGGALGGHACMQVQVHIYLHACAT